MATGRDMERKQSVSSVPFHSVLALARSCGIPVGFLSNQHIASLMKLSTTALEDPQLKISTCCAVTASFAEINVRLGVDPVMDQMVYEWAMKTMHITQQTEFPSVDMIEVTAKQIDGLLLSLHTMGLKVNNLRKDLPYTVLPSKCLPLVHEIPVTLTKVLPFVSATTCFSLISRYVVSILIVINGVVALMSIACPAHGR